MTQVTTFGTLKSELLAVIGRAPSDAAYQLVRADINRDLRLEEMIATATINLADYAPTTHLSFIDVYVVDSGGRRVLRPTSVDTLNREYQASGNATKYAVAGEVMRLNTSEDPDMVVKYYTPVADFANDDATNDILTRFPGIYWYGSLFHHSKMIRDDQAAAGYQQDYIREMRLAQATNARDKMAGSPLTVRPRAVA